jgi:hypothetical protein
VTVRRLIVYLSVFFGDRCVPAPFPFHRLFSVPLSIAFPVQIYAGNRPQFGHVAHWNEEPTR